MMDSWRALLEDRLGPFEAPCRQDGAILLKPESKQVEIVILPDGRITVRRRLGGGGMMMLRLVAENGTWRLFGVAGPVFTATCEEDGRALLDYLLSAEAPSSA